MNLEGKLNQIVETELKNLENTQVEWQEFKEYKSGIYMLLQDDVVVYVGISEYYPQRISTHRKSYNNRKKFNKVLVYEVSDYHRALCLESYYIKKYKPKYNKNDGILVDSVTSNLGFHKWEFSDIDKIVLQDLRKPSNINWRN